MANYLSRIVSSGFKQGSAITPIDMEWYAKYSDTGFKRLDSAWAVRRAQEGTLVYYEKYPTPILPPITDWTYIGELRPGKHYYARNQHTRTLYVRIVTDDTQDEQTYTLALPYTIYGECSYWGYDPVTDLVCHSGGGYYTPLNTTFGIDLVGRQVVEWLTTHTSDDGYRAAAGTVSYQSGKLVRYEANEDGTNSRIRGRNYPDMSINWEHETSSYVYMPVMWRYTSDPDIVATRTDRPDAPLMLININTGASTTMSVPAHFYTDSMPIQL